MIKRIVVAANYSQFATYCRNRNFVREETAYYKAGEPWHCNGLSSDIPIHMLDGWSENKKLTDEDLAYLKRKFKTIKQIPEWRIYSEDFSI